jgi:DNA-binding MarR family transcriptional regulator
VALIYLSPIHKAVRQISLFLEPKCAALGVSPAEGHLLSYLRSYAPCSIAEILRVFGTRPSTMTSMLERLETNGLLTREPDPEDRRSVRVDLTKEGKVAAERIDRLVRDLERSIGTRVKPNQLQGFRTVMGAVEAATGVQVRKESSS